MVGCIVELIEVSVTARYLYDERGDDGEWRMENGVMEKDEGWNIIGLVSIPINC